MPTGTTTRNESLQSGDYPTDPLRTVGPLPDLDIAECSAVTFIPVTLVRLTLATIENWFPWRSNVPMRALLSPLTQTMYATALTALGGGSWVAVMLTVAPVLV